MAISETRAEDEAETGNAPASIDDLRDRWSRLTDVHQFFGMLKALKLSRRQADPTRFNPTPVRHPVPCSEPGDSCCLFYLMLC